MRIRLSSLIVEDQGRALEFYTRVLGFAPKHDIPMGEFRWLTVVSPEDAGGTELVLEPNANPAAKTWQQALFAQGIPAAAFEVDDVHAEAARLKALGVAFKLEPMQAGPVVIARFDDTVGNLVQIYQPPKQ